MYRNWANNNLREVQEGAFIGLENSLESVYLTGNELYYFPKLTQLDELQTLNLVNNEIQFIEYNAFANAPDITDL